MPPKTESSILVPCPSCGAEVLWAESSLYRPFCSESCRQRDWSAWASEDYVVGHEDINEDQK